MQTDCASWHVHFGILNTLLIGEIMRYTSYFTTVTYWIIMDKPFIFNQADSNPLN